MRQSFFSVACPVLLSLIICYLVVAYCRFKRQISDKTQYTVSGYLEKPQHIEQYTKNSPVFGVEIKYRAVSIYSFSEENTAGRLSDERMQTQPDLVKQTPLPGILPHSRHTRRASAPN